MTSKLYPITPVAKPRMTRSDKWRKRPATTKYWAFKDECQKLGVKFFPGCGIRFFIPMPVSWSQKKRDFMVGKPHQSEPDLDNLLKALSDAVWPKHDQFLWSYSLLEKVWSKEGAIEIIDAE
ncbi:MAG: RusA family crossover junction endodeoxyribonuclease [Magnetococcus sp. WYHC-3]